MKHLGYQFSAIRIGNNIIYTAEGPVNVTERGNAGPPAHLTLGSNAAFYINALIVILQFGLRAEDHEQELFIRIVSKGLRIGADVQQLPLIHEIYNCAEITGVSA